MGEPADDVVKTYRYVRLSVVVVVLSLVAAVVIERTKTDCWLGSFSAYYYTPVHAMFIGALVAIGVGLIAIKGRNWEDMFLNVAGLLAAVVAFVPTSRPSGVCSPSGSFGEFDAEAYIDNNVLALAFGVAVTIGMAWWIAKVQEAQLVTRDRYAAVGLVVSIVLMVAGVVWYYAFRPSFLDHAHNAAAIAMFVFIGGVILINAVRGSKGYLILYATLVAVMFWAAVVIGLTRLAVADWRHSVLVLELIELGAFGVFWVAHTVQYWKKPVP